MEKMIADLNVRFDEVLDRMKLRQIRIEEAAIEISAED
jgi:hypothetical protein